MNESNETTYTENENEEAKNPIYSSKFLMSKDLYYDFCSISYKASKLISFAYLCIVAGLIVIDLLSGDYDTITGFGSFFITFIAILIYFKTKRAIKIGYERMVISNGKESVLHYEFFEDKIISHNDELKREYFYHQITKFYETKKFILLLLKHKLCITIEKNNLNSSVDEIKPFLIEKCTNVKKKKFINCVNDKKWALVFLIALIVVYVIGIVVWFVRLLNIY